MVKAYQQQLGDNTMETLRSQIKNAVKTNKELLVNLTPGPLKRSLYQLISSLQATYSVEPIHLHFPNGINIDAKLLPELPIEIQIIQVASKFALDSFQEENLTYAPEVFIEKIQKKTGKEIWDVYLIAFESEFSVEKEYELSLEKDKEGAIFVADCDSY